jgi:tetratricopeptide (TPR) repeat protein
MKKFCLLTMVVILVLLVGCVSSAKSKEQVAQKRKADIDIADKNWNEAMKEQDWIRAVDAYTGIISNYPDYVSAYDYRGIAYLCLGEKEKAIDDFNEALKFEPDRWSTRQNMLQVSVPTDAIIAYQRGQMASKQSAKIEAFTEAIQLYPDYFHAYHNRGVAYFYKYMIDEAEVDWSKAYKMWPDHYLVLYNLARIYKFNGDYDKAIEYLERSLEIRSDYSSAKRELDEVRRLNNPQSEREKNLSFIKKTENSLIKGFLKHWETLDDENKAYFRTEFPDAYKAHFED